MEECLAERSRVRKGLPVMVLLPCRMQNAAMTELWHIVMTYLTHGEWRLAREEALRDTQRGEVSFTAPAN